MAKERDREAQLLSRWPVEIPLLTFMKCYLHYQILTWPGIFSLKQLKFLFTHIVQCSMTHFNFSTSVLSLGILPGSLWYRKVTMSLPKPTCLSAEHAILEWKRRCNVVFLPAVTHLKYIIWAWNVWAFLSLRAALAGSTPETGPPGWRCLWHSWSQPVYMVLECSLTPFLSFQGYYWTRVLLEWCIAGHLCLVTRGWKFERHNWL